MHPEINRLFSRSAERHGLTLSRSVQSRAAQFFALLDTWREKMNLVGLTDPESIVDKLFMPSFFLAGKMEKGPEILVDIGTGAGFPGLILKLVHEEKQVILIESNFKKTVFLREAKDTLGLKGLDIERIRFEEFCRDRTGPADSLTCRGAWSPRRMPERCAGILRPGGLLYRFVRADAAKEDMATRRGTLIFDQDYLLPDPQSAIYRWKKIE
jgi:16S rRNA (guanine527-N7)-methyltransferase